jgi:glycosyltransferase involved in cell wall biosynthesis
MDEKPMVSILMTAYNRENYIAEAIESVLASSYENWELIITDDCSTDATLHIAKKYVLLDSRVKVFKNETNLGDYPNRNRAASYAKGVYLKYLDADDLIYTYGLAAMVTAMQRFPDAGFALSYWKIDDELPYPQLINNQDIIRYEFLYKSLIAAGPSASIIKKEVFNAVGGFSGQQYIGDTELWLNIGSKYSLVKMAPSLVWYRRHSSQQINSERKNCDIAVKRHELSILFLRNHKSLFSEKEYLFAEKRLRRNFSRKNLSDLIYTLDFERFWSIHRKTGLSFIDVIKGFKPYLGKYQEGS